MADLLIRVDDSGNKEDGDVIFAAQDKHIYMVHAEHICKRTKFSKNADGLYVPGTLAEDYYLRTHQYKFTRVGNAVERLEIRTSITEVFDSTPRIVDGKAQHIFVEEFIQKAKRHSGHKLFGSDGSEVWYGGKVYHDEINSLWDDIEAKSTKRKNQHDFWPFSDRERGAWLALPVIDFDDKEMERISEPLYLTDDNGEFILDEAGQRTVEKFRRAKIDWREKLSDLGISEADVKNKELKLDLRGKPKSDQREIRVKKPNRGGL